jgi:hypothetical protein
VRDVIGFLGGTESWGFGTYRDASVCRCTSSAQSVERKLCWCGIFACTDGAWLTHLKIEVEVDEFGMSAIDLEQILENWPSDSKRPRVV